MNGFDLIKSIAPAIATALGGPLAGAAAAFLADKLGASEKTVESVKEIITGNSMTPEQVAQIKLAEIDFKKFLESNKIRIEEIHAADRDSARKMQIATNSWVPPVLSIGITTGFFSILSWMLTKDFKASEPLLVMLGSLGTAWVAVVNYWFGSSAGSDRKTDLLSAK
jgi:hypothetical protein